MPALHYTEKIVRDYTETTQGISVTVEPAYLREHSTPEEGFYAWSYQVSIVNRGDVTVQLMNRYWHITDATGHVEEVRGPGVVGEQPVLKPGERFDYASWTYLHTPGGIMRGHYEMEEIHEDVSPPPLRGAAVGALPCLSQTAVAVERAARPVGGHAKRVPLCGAIVPRGDAVRSPRDRRRGRSGPCSLSSGRPRGAGAR